MKVFLAVLLTYMVQWMLGIPAAPSWLQWVLLPMVWIVAPPMRHRFDRIFFVGLALGLGWDLLFEPIVGPGMIAWSATALVVAWIIRKVGDHSARSWSILGAVGTVLVSGVAYLALLPLGAASLPRLADLAVGAILTGLWCGLVAFVLAMNLPARVRRYRRSRLR